MLWEITCVKHCIVNVKKNFRLRLYRPTIHDAGMERLCNTIRRSPVYLVSRDETRRDETDGTWVKMHVKTSSRPPDHLSNPHPPTEPLLTLTHDLHRQVKWGPFSVTPTTYTSRTNTTQSNPTNHANLFLRWSYLRTCKTGGMKTTRGTLHIFFRVFQSHYHNNRKVQS